MAYSKRPALGQAAMAASEPVVIASDQSAVPVSNSTATNLKAEVIGTGTFATQATLAAETTKVIGTVNVAAGQSIGITANSSVNNAQTAGTATSVNNGTADAGTQRVTLASDSSGQVKLAANSGVDIGKLTANQSVNVAQMNAVNVLMGAGNTGTGSQRVTIATDQAAVASKAAINTYVDGAIVTLGAKADAKSTATDTTAVTLMQVEKQISASVQTIPSNVAHDSPDSGNPLKVGGRASTTPVTAVAANDRVDAFFDVQGRQAVTQKALTGTASNVNGSASNVTLLAANTARLGATLYNDSTAICYVKLGATASATSFAVKMNAGAYYEVPFGYYGIIDGIWASATGVMRATEIS